MFKNNITKKVFTIILSVAIAVSFFSFTSKINKVNAETNLFEEKIIEEIDESREFAEDKVLVVLDRSISRIYGLATTFLDKLFSKINYSEIEDLTKFSEINKQTEEYYSSHSFNQILSIKLLTQTRENVIRTVKILQNIPGIKYVAPDYYLSIDDGEENDEPAEECVEEVSELQPEISMYANNVDSDPSDPRFSEQWGLTGEYGIDAKVAWRFTKGSQEIKVGVIDRGIAKHEDLDANVTEGYDFEYSNPNTSDDYGDHGTHVAGIIGAVGNNGKGVTGVAQNVKMVPLQILSAESDTSVSGAAAVKAIQYATDRYFRDRIHVLNYSCSGYGTDTFIAQAAKNYPGLFVWAAGNFYKNIQYNSVGVFDADNIISVGAIQKNGSKSAYSNYGDKVEVFAPGDNILSTVRDGYGLMSGTSMAAPFVSGIAALLCSLDNGLRGAELKNIIKSSSFPYSYSVTNGCASTTFLSRRASAVEAINYYYSNEVPKYLDLQVVGKTGSNWQVKITNPNNFLVYAAYNKKMCFAGDAKNFSGLADVSDLTLYANSSKTVSISENGTAGFITAVVGYNFRGCHYNRVSYACGLTQSGSTYSIGTIWHNTKTLDNYTEFTSLPSNLRFTIKGKSGGKWRVGIYNPNSVTVDVVYNSKMCFLADAQSFNGCNDTVKIRINARETKDVYISGNWFADYITARIDYYYHGFNYGGVTYANNLKTNSSSASESNNIIRLL